MTPSTKLRQVAARVRDAKLRARILTAAAAVQGPDGVESGVVESDDPVAVIKGAEEALKPLFADATRSDDAVAAAAAMAQTIAALTEQIDDILAVIPVEDETVAGVRVAMETVRAEVDSLQTLAQTWVDITTSDLETAHPKFPALPKTVLPNPSAETDKLPVVETPTPKEKPTEEVNERGSLLDQVAAS